MFAPYIDAFPSEEAAYLESAVLGAVGLGQQPLDPHRALHAVENVLNYATGQYYSDGSNGKTPVRTALPAPLSHGELCLHLRAARGHAMAGSIASSIPWGQIIATLGPVLIQILEGLAKGG